LWWKRRPVRDFFPSVGPIAHSGHFLFGKNRKSAKKSASPTHMCRASGGHWPPTETHSKHASGAYEMVSGRTEPGDNSLAENGDHQFYFLLGFYGNGVFTARPDRVRVTAGQLL
jgi:hypothetical protein